MGAKISLDVLTVKDPCTESWARMRGDDEVRFCGLCRMNVYNLSAMTKERAESLLEAREGRMCVRFYRRADGTVTTVDCAPARFEALRRTARRTMTAAAALLVTLLGFVASLGLFRVSGFDVGSWLEGTAVARLAKATGLEPEPVPEMGEAPEVFMGDVAEHEEPVDAPDVVVAPAE